MSEYKKAIILGDDPLPTPDFFEFGNWSLKNLNQHLLAIFVDITSFHRSIFGDRELEASSQSTTHA